MHNASNRILGARALRSFSRQTFAGARFCVVHREVIIPLYYTYYIPGIRGRSDIYFPKASAKIPSFNSKTCIMKKKTEIINLKLREK